MPWWAQLLAIVLTGTASWIISRQRDRSQIASTDAATSAATFNQLRECRRDLLATERLAEERERQLEECEAQNAALTARLLRTPAALAISTLEELNGMAKVIDLLRDPIVISTSEGGGTYALVNRAWCEKFNRPASDFLGQGWRRWLKPEDREETRKVETRAWDDPVWGFVNHYQHADGRWLLCRWYCKPYGKSGATWCVVVIDD